VGLTRNANPESPLLTGSYTADNLSIFRVSATLGRVYVYGFFSSNCSIFLFFRGAGVATVVSSYVYSFYLLLLVTIKKVEYNGLRNCRSGSFALCLSLYAWDDGSGHEMYRL